MHASSQLPAGYLRVHIGRARHAVRVRTDESVWPMAQSECLPLATTKWVPLHNMLVRRLGEAAQAAQPVLMSVLHGTSAGVDEQGVTAMSTLASCCWR